MALRDRIQALPLPLAQLLHRVDTAKSDVERHNNAYFLAEAALKLATSMRVALWLDRYFEQGSRLAASLEGLMMPSAGHWVRFLREADLVLTGCERISDTSLGRTAGALGMGRKDWKAVRRLARAACEEDVIATSEITERACNGGLLGFFEMVVAYRNEMFHNPGQWAASKYKRLFPFWLDAMEEVVASGLLYGEAGLLYSSLLLESPEATPELVWTELRGPNISRLSRDRWPTGNEIARAGVKPGRVYAFVEGQLLSLHPLVVYQEDDYGRGVAGFLNRTFLKTQRGEFGTLQEVRKADYVEYATGVLISKVNIEAALTNLLGRLRGREASAEDLRCAQNHSAMEFIDASEEAVTTGEVVGNFELGERIGSGGMAHVYKARQRTTGRTVAVKILPEVQSADRVKVERFRREIEVLSRCDDPNVIKILDAGADHGRIYYAMELVDGADLGRVGTLLWHWRRTGVSLEGGLLDAAARLAPDCRLTDEAGTVAGRGNDDPTVQVPEPPDAHGTGSFYDRLAALFEGAALGLAHLHKRKLVHRDIKPANIMLTADGARLVLMDLGLAKVTDSSDASLTRESMVGTVRYMAPEQVRGRESPVDGRTDIYGLGATMYEMATGEPMFKGDNHATLVHQILNATPPPPRRHSPALPTDLQTIIQAATAKEPALRHQSALQLADNLRRFVERRPLTVGAPGLLHRAALAAKRRPVLATVMCFLLLAALVGGGWLWYWSSEKLTWCANITERWMVPQCVGRVDSAVQVRREATYLLHESCGLVTLVERLNGSGKLRDDKEHQSRWEFEYYERGGVRKCTVSDQAGAVVRVLLYSDDRPHTEKHEDELGIPKPIPGSEAATVVEREFGKSGFVRKERYYDVFRNPRSNDENAFGYLRQTNYAGVLEELTSLDAQGSPAPTTIGLAKARYETDSAGNVLKAMTLDASGRPMLATDGTAGALKEYDEVGNVTRITSVDAAGDPVPDIGGCSVTKFLYDDRGNPTSIEHQDSGGEPCTPKDSLGKVAQEFDANGDLISVSCRGIDGEPTAGSSGTAKVSYERDQNRRVAAERYFDVKGKRTCNQEGVSGWKAQYDDRGRRIRTDYLGPDDKPTLHKGGYAGTLLAHDQTENRACVTYIGLDGNPVPGDSSYATYCLEYDERGQVVSTTFKNEKGDLTLTGEGYAGWTSDYDRRGYETLREYFGLKREPTVISGGYAKVKMQYDDRGNVSDLTFLDAAEKPVADSLGVVVWKFQYDRLGRRTRDACYDAAREPKDNRAGWSVRETDYDERGRAVKERYSDAAGARALGREGWATVSRSYDNRGNILRSDFFGADGRPGHARDRCASEAATYDQWDRAIEWRCYDADNRLTARSDGSAVRKHVFDARGNLVEVRYFDLDQKPMPGDPASGSRE